MLRKPTVGLFAVALLFLTLGCSDSKEKKEDCKEDKKRDGKKGDDIARDEVLMMGKITGKVTYDRKSVPVGIITFHPEKGTGVMVELENGKYTADKVPTGPVTVTVNT